MVIHYHTLPMNAILHQFKDITMPDSSWLDVQPKNITTDKQNPTYKRTRHCQKPLSWPPCCILREYVDSGEDVSVNTVRCPEKLGYNTTRRPKAGGWYCTPISKDEDRIHRYVRARVNVFTLLYREDLVNHFNIVLQTY